MDSALVAFATSTIISQRREALAQADELRELSESKTQFLSTVYHELKTPLTSVTAFIDLVLRNRDSNLNPRQVDHLKIVQRNNQRLNVLIDDLSDVSRISAGKLRIQLIKFDLAPVLEKLVEGLKPIFESKAQTVQLNLSNTALWIEAD